MSRIGKKILTIPQGVQVSIDNAHVAVKGPKGQLEWDMPEAISYEMKDGTLSFSRSSDEKHVRALHGLTRALIASMVEGVNNGYMKKLQIEGVGYRAEMRGTNLLLTVGYSHPILFIPPAGITFAVSSPTALSVAGIDKQLVGEIAAKIRRVRPPEPYKGKGIRYEGEQIRRKAGKSGSK